MSEEKNRKKGLPRQQWKPHFLLRVLYQIWMAAFSAFKIALGAAATVLLIGVVCGFVFVGILGDYLQDDILPMADMDMEDFDHTQNSYIYYVDNNGDIQVYQKVFGEYSSKWASYEDIPEDLINAAMAIEDHRFLEHQGVDWVTTIKACARMFFGDDSVGGSSITQQLIKNILLTEDETADDVTVQRKVLEIFRAIQLEKRYDKKTIMEMYLNCIYLGQKCQGVRSAAETYFGKELQMLTTAECASLISITNNPSLYDPYGETFPFRTSEDEEPVEMSGLERNKYRQENVLWAMREYGWLTDEEYEEAINQELILKDGIDDEDRLAKCPNESCGYQNIVRNFVTDGENYYCPQCNTATLVGKNESQYYYSWFTDTVLIDVAKDLAKKNGMAWNENTKKLCLEQISSGGYHIYTTLDLDVQDQVDAIYSNLEEIPETRSGQQLQSAIVVIDNSTGDIVALAGGVGEKTGYIQWNRATQAQLQSGSSVKPISVYIPAFESGAITPATVIKDLPLIYEDGDPYPLNDSRTYSYARTIRSAVVSSVNAVCANTLDKIGVGYAFDFAKNQLGLSTLVESYEDETGYIHSDMAIGPLALGAQTWGVTVRDMTTAFATLANEGVYRTSRTYTKVYDSEGNLILDNEQQSHQAFSSKTANYMNYCLAHATSRGTGTEARFDGMEIAGKTGTSGDNKDRWYSGLTKYYTAAVWTGYDTPETVRVLSGNNPAARLWKKVMQPLHEGLEYKDVYSSSGMRTVKVCLDSGGYATDACAADIRGVERVDSAYVYPEDISGSSCSKHVMVDVCSGGGVATEICKLFAAVDPTVTISQGSLVKRTPSEIEDLLKASKHRLDEEHLMDNYVYLINKDGSDGVWNGFHGDLNQHVDAPYMVCPVHTQEAWDLYQQSLITNPLEPSAPVDPNVPVDPTVQSPVSEPAA